MNLIINGEAKQLELETLADLVAHFNLDKNLVVTEVNGLIISLEERSETKLSEGMKIEIVQFVGGG